MLSEKRMAPQSRARAWWTRSLRRKMPVASAREVAVGRAERIAVSLSSGDCEVSVVCWKSEGMRLSCSVMEERAMLEYVCSG